MWVIMVTSKKSGTDCGEKLTERNLLFPSFKVVNFSNSTAFSAKNTCPTREEIAAAGI